MVTMTVNPGDVVVSNFGIYQHWSMVTDKLCEQGKNMLISATKRNGTVHEEPWDVVTQDCHTYVVEVNTAKSTSQLLSDARSQIGRWVYSLTDNNCEHFVKWSAGLKVSSSQVKAGIGGAVAGVALVGVVSENPKLYKYVGIGLLAAGLGVLIVKVVEKKPA